MCSDDFWWFLIGPEIIKEPFLMNFLLNANLSKFLDKVLRNIVGGIYISHAPLVRPRLCPIRNLRVLSSIISGATLIHTHPDWKLDIIYHHDSKHWIENSAENSPWQYRVISQWNRTWLKNQNWCKKSSRFDVSIICLALSDGRSSDCFSKRALSLYKRRMKWFWFEVV